MTCLTLYLEQTQVEETDYFAVFPPTWGRVGDISIIFSCSFAVGITQQYGIYVLLG